MSRRLEAVRAAFARPRSAWPWMAIAALALTAHLEAIPNPFFYDDWNTIQENPYMVHPQALRKMFGGNVWDFLGRVGVGNYYRPMMHVFHYGVYHLLGRSPGWFHLACLLLHAGVSLLVAAVVRRITGRHAIGILAGLLFAVHPIHAEVVAWISCSPELLASFFSLLALLLYLKATDPPQPAGIRRAALAAAMALSVLTAALSKEIGVMAPAIIVAYDLLVRRCGPIEQLRRVWPEYLALAAATAVYLAMRVTALGGLVPVHRRSALPWTEHLWTSAALFYRYLKLLFWPVELNFFWYYHPNRSPAEPAVLAGVVSMAALVAAGVWLYRRRAPETLALPIYLLTLLPVFQLPYIFTGLLLVERAAYLPSVAFCWLVAAGLVKLAGRIGTRPVVALAALLLAGYTARSAVRMLDWRDEVELFREGVARAPEFFHIHSFRGEVLLRHNRPAEAVQSLRESIRLRDNYADAHNYLGRAYLMLEQHGLALQHYRRAAELSLRDGRPDSASRAWNNIGIVYRSEERNQEAIAAYRQALALDPEFAAARNNLGFVLLLEGRVEEALGELRVAVSQDAALVPAHANVGLAYAMLRQWDSALDALRRAERLSPDNAEVQARMGEVYLAQGQAGEARRRFLRALQLHSQNARAQAGLAAWRGREGPPHEAQR